MRMRLVAALMSVFFLSTLSAILVAGHTWRFPPSILALVDTKFVTSIVFPFGQNVLIAIAILKLVSLLCRALFSKQKKWYVFEEARFALSFCGYAFGAFLSAYTFIIRYVGMSMFESNVTIVLLVGMIGVTLYSSDKMLAHLYETLQQHEIDEMTLTESLQEVVLSPLFGMTLALGILMSSLCGELRMTYLMDESNAVLRFDGGDATSRPEVKNIVGPMANGILFAFYRGEKYSNEKTILFTFISNGPVETLEVEWTSKLGTLLGLP